MTTATSDRHARPARGLRAAALLALLAFGCTTVRVPASAIAPAIPVHGDAAEPQLELWLESGGQVSPSETARAAAEARAALDQALATRRVAEGEQMLVVRAQGVSRTGSRRAGQHAAVAAMVVGAVAVVVAVVASKGSGGKGAARARVPGVRPAPVPAAAPPPVRPGSTWLPPPARAAPPTPWPRPVAGSHRGAAGTVSADVQIVFPVSPPSPGWVEAGGGPGSSPAAPVPVPAGPVPPGAPPAWTVVLPSPRPLDVADRGYFAGDLLRLELTLVDRRTGTPLWVKTVERDADPRDPAAVRALLDGALDDPSGWSAAEAPR